MEHARKMLLVDPGDFRNIRQHHSLLDKSISDVLSRRDIGDEEKLSLYQQALNRFLVNRRTIEKELEEPLKVTEPEVKQNIKEAYLESLDPEERKRAQRILEDLGAYTPLRWDEKGRMIHEGRTIEDSKLNKLISHKLKSVNKRKKSKPPIGWETYSTYRGRQTTPASHITPRPQRRMKAPSWQLY